MDTRTPFSPTRKAAPRRAVPVVAVFVLAAAMAVVPSVVSPPRAEAEQVCGDPEQAGTIAQSPSRWSRLRTWGCLDVGGGSVQAIGVASADHPASCDPRYGFDCGANSAKPHAHFLWVEMTVKVQGQTAPKCRWGEQTAAHDLRFTCTIDPRFPDPPGAQRFIVETQLCFDVKDEPEGARCTGWSTFARDI